MRLNYREIIRIIIILEMLNVIRKIKTNISVFIFTTISYFSSEKIFFLYFQFFCLMIAYYFHGATK